MIGSLPRFTGWFPYEIMISQDNKWGKTGLNGTPRLWANTLWLHSFCEPTVKELWVLHAFASDSCVSGLQNSLHSSPFQPVSGQTMKIKSQRNAKNAERWNNQPVAPRHKEISKVVKRCSWPNNQNSCISQTLQGFTGFHMLRGILAAVKGHGHHGYWCLRKHQHQRNENAMVPTPGSICGASQTFLCQEGDDTIRQFRASRCRIGVFVAFLVGDWKNWERNADDMECLRHEKT